LIRAIYFVALICCQLLGNNKVESFVSFEYWISEEFKLFSIEDVFVLKIENDIINVSSNNWFGELILEENIEYDKQAFSINSLFNRMFIKKNVMQEDLWINEIILLDDKKIKVRYLYSYENDGEKLFRMDIEKLNKDDDDNIINSVILNHDLIKVWTNLDNDIKRISFTYNNASYIIKFNEE
jgi:hypothetical protein|tara:strand:- start:16624 stop:17169 length:546 start_codon:yes stop_codon:yes gene_type:complete